MRALSVLGSTGSIGRQTLEVAAACGHRVLALTAHHNIALLEQQARTFHPILAAAADPTAAAALAMRLSDTDIRVLAGEEGVLAAARLPQADTAVTALVGIAGLAPTLAAIDSGKRIALANKETLVCAGPLVMARALQHPNWSMGAKVTIDSATLMNKGLELLEAMSLFDVLPEKIQILIHRESILHSAVEYCDNSVIAQLGDPDMRLPIQYALSWPDRTPGPARPLDLLSVGKLTFAQPDLKTFRCLALAIRAAREGGTAPAILNGANEVAVERFLAGKIGFLQIPQVVEAALDTVPRAAALTLESIQAADQAARRAAARAAEG